MSAGALKQHLLFRCHIRKCSCDSASPVRAINTYEKLIVFDPAVFYILPWQIAEPNKITDIAQINLNPMRMYWFCRPPFRMPECVWITIQCILSRKGGGSILIAVNAHNPAISRKKSGFSHINSKRLCAESLAITHDQFNRMIAKISGSRCAIKIGSAFTIVCQSQPVCYRAGNGDGIFLWIHGGDSIVVRRAHVCTTGRSTRKDRQRD